MRMFLNGEWVERPHQIDGRIRFRAPRLHARVNHVVVIDDRDGDRARYPFD